MDYYLNIEGWGGISALPSSIGAYLAEANGASLKVLLFLVTAKQRPNHEEIGKALSLTEEQVADSLQYWAAKGILTQSKVVMVKSAPQPSARDITSEELADMRQNNEQARCLFDSAEQLYSRPLNALERRTLLYVLQYTQLPIDVILMILDYVIRIGKSSPQYFQKVCNDWAEKEINTHQKAEEKIRDLLAQNERERLVKNCFGIHGRKLTAKEIGFIKQWMDNYAFAIDMIRLAYEKAVDATGGISFPYINKVLSNWHSKGLKTPKEVSEKDHNPNAKEALPSYNMNELAQKGLFVPEQ